MIRKFYQNLARPELTIKKFCRQICLLMDENNDSKMLNGVIKQSKYIFLFAFQNDILIQNEMRKTLVFYTGQ
jgi:hypothetical protein